MTQDSLWSDYRHDFEHEESSSRAVYDYAPTGALLLQYEKDDVFTAKLRALVDPGFITWTRSPFHWVIDADFAEDVLTLCRENFEHVDHGDIE